MLRFQEVGNASQGKKFADKSKAASAESQSLATCPTQPQPAAAVHENASSSAGPISKGKSEKKQKQPAGKGKSSQQKANDKVDRQHKSNEGKQAKSKENQVPESSQQTYLEGIKQILQECHDTDCSHGDFDMKAPHADGFQLTVYWSRDAVGVKASHDRLVDQPKPKAKAKGEKSDKKKAYKSKNFSQIAYFSAGGCVYINYKMAQLFDTWKHIFACMVLYHTTKHPY